MELVLGDRGQPCLQCRLESELVGMDQRFQNGLLNEIVRQ
jgi:hypothetical protein